MKKLILILVTLFLISIQTQAQSKEFKLKKIADIKMSKNEIFNSTKMFIADVFNSGKVVTQNADKESGVIQLKASTSITQSIGMGMYNTYLYDYKIVFKLKDNKYKVEVYDVVCSSAMQVGLADTDILKIQPFFGEEPLGKTKSWGKGLSKKKAVIMMKKLIITFESFIASYEKSLLKKDEDGF